MSKSEDLDTNLSPKDSLLPTPPAGLMTLLAGHHETGTTGLEASAGRVWHATKSRGQFSPAEASMPLSLS